MDIRSEFTHLLAEIEDEMRTVLAEHDGHVHPLYEMLAYHLGLDEPSRPRGKRIRPLLGLLAYQSLTGEHETALPGAAAVELGHNFSLVHDDIEDVDRERHHRPTLWAIWGIPLAINAGDALFALSRLALYRLLDRGVSEHRVLALMRVYDETCLALCEGQFLDISFERRLDVSVEAYLAMISRKTAALFGASVQSGAILATDDRDTIEAFRRFGYELGMAFQMADDVKGTFWSSSASGKPVAGDVRQQKKTLPLVWAFEHAEPADVERLRRLYAPPDGPANEPPPAGTVNLLEEAEVEEVLAILERSGAREHTIGEARRLRDRALQTAMELPIDPKRREQIAAIVQSAIAV